MNEIIQKRFDAFVELGVRLHSIISDGAPLSPASIAFKQLIAKAETQNAWFTQDNIKWALEGIVSMLNKETLHNWLNRYDLKPIDPKTIAVIMAGNLPLVGFHDFMCVILSGNNFLGKLSGQDKLLPAGIAQILCEIEPSLKPHITFSEERISNFDAVIATGSNNSARYFEYYFGKYPHIIRKNRTSIAVLSGNETQSDLSLLTDDVCKYFGMGCRSVSKVFVPRGFDLQHLIREFSKWDTLRFHSRYYNNYEYHKAIYLVNREKHLDNGFLILKEEAGLSSPLAVLYYQYYESLQEVMDYIASHNENLQCIATHLPMDTLENMTVVPGKTQMPGPDDYADRVDTMEFLKGL